MRMQNAVYELKNAINTIKTILDSYDQIFRVSSTYRYVSYDDEIYIGAKDPEKKGQSRHMFESLRQQLDELEQVYADLENQQVADLSKEEILNAYVILKNIGSNLMIRGELNYTVFKESITTVSLTQSVIDRYAESLGTSVQSTGIRYIQSYATTVDTLARIQDDSSLPDKKRELDVAELALQQARTTLERNQLSVNTLLLEQQRAKVQLQRDIDTKQRNIRRIQNGESLNETRINQARNAVTRSRDRLDSLMDNYKDYWIEANFDGVITQMDMQIGDNIELSSNTDTKYMYVESNNILEMQLDVEQVDIMKLRVGMEVIVYLDAYPRETYQGVISEVNTIPTGGG